MFAKTLSSSQNEELTELLYLCSCEALLFQIYYKLVGPMNFEWTRFFGPTFNWCTWGNGCLGELHGPQHDKFFLGVLHGP